MAIADPTPAPNAPTGQTTAYPVAAPAPPPPAPVLAPKFESPSSDADYLNNPRPEYPRLSRQRAEQGKVVVNVYIGPDGVAQKAEIKTSSGFERLDQAALATAKSWRYVPGKRGGVPEAMWFSVPINFVLE
jgi:protein TonB